MESSVTLLPNKDNTKPNKVIDAIRESVEKNGVKIQVVQMDCDDDGRAIKVVSAVREIVSDEIKEIKEHHFREAIAKFSIGEIEDGLKEIAKKEILAERMHRDAKQMLKTVRDLLLAKMDERRAEESMPLLQKMIEES